MITVAVLVSAGRHPGSARLRRAVCDACAVEVALRIPDAQVELVHAGAHGEAVLREYLGMGKMGATTLEMPAECDIGPALIEHLRRLRPALVIAGLVAEAGPCEGMLPYRVAHALDYTLLPSICEITIDGRNVNAMQVLPRGLRRNLRAPSPAVLTVGPAIVEPRQSAFGKARSATVRCVSTGTPVVPYRTDFEAMHARRRPRRLKLLAGANARERLAAAIDMPEGRGTVLSDVTPDEAALAILTYLRSARVLDSHPELDSGDQHESHPH